MILHEIFAAYFTNLRYYFETLKFYDLHFQVAHYLFCNVTYLIIHKKKLLDSDWLRAVQFKCKSSAKNVTQLQITHRNSGL